MKMTAIARIWRCIVEAWTWRSFQAETDRIRKENEQLRSADPWVRFQAWRKMGSK
jgi:hypothetical protein